MESAQTYSPAGRAPIYALATTVVVAVAGAAFAVGWLLGRILS